MKRYGLARAVAACGMLSVQSGAAAPLKAISHGPLSLVGYTHIAGLEGDLNVAVADIANDHLLVSADKQGVIEVFNLHDGRLLKTIRAAQEPHMLAYVAAKHEIWIGDAGTSAIIIIDAKTFEEKQRISLPTAPTVGLYDPTRHRFYIQNGGLNAKMTHSTINIIDTDSRQLLGTVSIDAVNLEAMAINGTGDRLYVNVRDKKRIDVIDLDRRVSIDSWTVPGLNLNTPMAIDPKAGRLFVAGRKPGTLYVLDTSNGKVVSRSDCVELADHMEWDPARKRLYVTGVSGANVFRQLTADRYQKMVEFPTNGGKVGLSVGSLDRFYILHRKTDIDIAGLEIFHVND